MNTLPIKSGLEFCVVSKRGMDWNTKVAMLFGRRVRFVDLAAIRAAIGFIIRAQIQDGLQSVLALNRRQARFLPKTPSTLSSSPMDSILDLRDLQSQRKDLARALWAKSREAVMAIRNAQYVLGCPAAFRGHQYFADAVLEALILALCERSLNDVLELDAPDLMRVRESVEPYLGPALSELMGFIEPIRLALGGSLNVDRDAIRKQAHYFIAARIMTVLFRAERDAENLVEAQRKAQWNRLAEYWELAVEIVRRPTKWYTTAETL